MSAKLVVSYSHVDRAQISQVVSLLKAAFRVRTAVFWDDDFEPGELWFQQITKHIERAPQLFVFWCAHSAASEQVRREFLYALAREKRVVPVLLDDTPLVVELAPIQWIDLRQAVRHVVDVRDSATKPESAASELDDTHFSPPPMREASMPRSRRPGPLLVIFIASLALIAYQEFTTSASNPMFPALVVIGLVLALVRLAYDLFSGRTTRKVWRAELETIVIDRQIVEESSIVDAFAPYLSQRGAEGWPTVTPPPRFP